MIMTDHEALKKVGKILDDNYFLGVGGTSDNLGDVLSPVYDIIDNQEQNHDKKESQKKTNILINEYEEIRKTYPVLLNNFVYSKRCNNELIKVLQFSRELSNLPTYHNPKLVKKVLLEIKGFLILNTGLKNSTNAK